MHDDAIDSFVYGLERLNIPYYNYGCNRNKNYYYNPYFEDRFKIEHEGIFALEPRKNCKSLTQLKNCYAPYECDPIKNTQCPKTECFIRGGYCHSTFNENYKKEGEKSMMHRTTLGKINYVIKQNFVWNCLEEKIGRRVLDTLNPFMTVRFEQRLEMCSYRGSRSTLWITNDFAGTHDISWPHGDNCPREFMMTGNIVVEVPYEFYREFRTAVENTEYDSSYAFRGWSGYKVLEYADRDRYETTIRALKWELNSLYGIKCADHITPDSIEEVIFNKPATIIKWKDGSKTVVRAQGKDKYDPEKGLAIAIAKKSLGNKHEYYNTFKHWLKKCK